MSLLRIKLKKSIKPERDDFLNSFAPAFAKAGYTYKLFDLLSNFDFIEIKIRELGVQSLENDYSFLEHELIYKSEGYDENSVYSLNLIKKVLRQTSNLLEEDPNQLPGLLISNLSNIDNNLIEKLLNQAKAHQEETWLLPVNVEKKNIDQPLETAIPSGHQGDIKALDISDDGQWAVSSARDDSYMNRLSRNTDDNVFKVWNITERRLERTLEIHPVKIADGRELYDDDFYRNIQVPVRHLAVSHDAKWCASAGKLDKNYVNDDIIVIDVWDLQTQESVKQLVVEREDIGSLDIVAVDIFDPSIDHPDDAPRKKLELRIIASFDKYAKIWTLSIEKETANDEPNYTILGCNLINHLFKSEGYSYQNKVALSPSGNIAVMATKKILSYWNLVEGCLEYFVPIELPEDTNIEIIKASSDGKVSIVFSNKELEIYDFPQFRYDQPCSIDSGIDRLIHYNQEYPHQEFPRELFLLKNLVSLAPKQISYLLSSNIRRKLFSCITIKTFNAILAIASKFSDSRSLLTKLDFNRITSLSLTYKEISSRKIPLKLENLDIPSCITNDLKTALIKTERNDIQIVNLSDAIQDNLTPRETNPTPKGHTGSSSWIDAVAVSLDGKHVIEKTEQQSYILWDVLHKQRHELYVSEEHSLNNINLFAQSLDKKWILGISNSNTLMEWDTQGSYQSKLVNLSYLFKAISSNGRWALMQSYARTLHLQELQTGNIVASFYDYYGIINLDLNIDPLSSFQAERFDRYSAKSIEEWGFRTYCKDKVSISNDGNFVAIHTRQLSGHKWIWEGAVSELTIWDIRNNNIKKFNSPIPSTDITDIAIDGCILCIGMKNGQIFVADIEQNTQSFIISAHTKGVTSIKISSETMYLVSSSMDQTVKVFSTDSGQYIAGFTLDDPIIDSKISTDNSGTTFITAIDIDSKIHTFELILSDIRIDTSEANIRSSEESFAFRTLRCPIFPDIPLWDDESISLFISSAPSVLDHLVESLINENFEQADIETKIILENSVLEQGIEFTSTTLEHIPNSLLYGIDQLWLKYSNGQYSFSIQSRIYKAIPYINTFQEVVGRGAKLIENNFTQYFSNRKGHFPWAIGLENTSFFTALMEKVSALYNQDNSEQDFGDTSSNITPALEENYLDNTLTNTQRTEDQRKYTENKLKYIFEQSILCQSTQQNDISSKQVKNLHIYAVPGCYVQVRCEILMPGKLIFSLYEHQELVGKPNYTISDNFQCPFIAFNIPEEFNSNELKGSMVFKPSNKNTPEFAVDIKISLLVFSSNLRNVRNQPIDIFSYRFINQIIDSSGTEYHPCVSQALVNLVSFYDGRREFKEATLLRNRRKNIEAERITVFPIKQEPMVCFYILSPESIA